MFATFFCVYFVYDSYTTNNNNSRDESQSPQTACFVLCTELQQVVAKSLNTLFHGSNDVSVIVQLVTAESVGVEPGYSIV